MIFPALLSPERPALDDSDYNESRSYRYSFEGFIPQHILQSLISDHHRDIARRGVPPQDLVWQYGVVLRPSIDTYDASAVIELRDYSRQLQLTIFGPDRESYAAMLRRSISDTLEPLPELIVKEEMQLLVTMLDGESEKIETRSGDAVEWIALQQLQTALKRGMDVVVTASGRSYSIRKILAGPRAALSDHPHAKPQSPPHTAFATTHQSVLVFAGRCFRGKGDSPRLVQECISCQPLAARPHDI